MTVIRVKHSTGSTAPANGTLAFSELAFTDGDNKLHIGKNDNTTHTFPLGGTVAWGGITGTLADQTDLNTALDGKQASDPKLADIAGLTGMSAGDLIQWDGSNFVAVSEIDGGTF